MNGWMTVLTAVLAVLAAVLAGKVYLLKKSAREIGDAFAEKIRQETNTPVCLSSRDREMRHLAEEINAQLALFHQGRRRFEHGDLEIKEAITNMSHDLRTPLTAIYGYLSLLEQEECSEQARAYLAAVDGRVRAMKQLTEELFQYTMAVSDTEELPLEKISMNAVLEGAVSAYYGVFQERHMIPSISLPEQKVERVLNEQALSRVLGNILSNALKYSDGDLTICLTEQAEITFSNHAAGLTEVQVGRLFDRVYTVSSARKSTGLGLSIAKTLTEKMGGAISASYEKGVLTISLRFD